MCIVDELIWINLNDRAFFWENTDKHYVVGFIMFIGF